MLSRANQRLRDFEERDAKARGQSPTYTPERGPPSPKRQHSAPPVTTEGGPGARLAETSPTLGPAEEGQGETSDAEEKQASEKEEDEKREEGECSPPHALRRLPVH